MNGGVGQHARGLLEGGGGQETVGGQRGLGDAQQYRRADGLFQVDIALLDAGAHAGVLRVKLGFVDHRAGQQIGVAGVFHADLAHHLTHDDLDVLVVDVNALHPVSALHFLNQVVLHRLFAEHGQNVVRVDAAFGDAVALFDVVALLHAHARAVGDDVAALVDVAVGIVGDVHHLFLLLFAETDHAVDLTDDGEMLGLAAFEQFFHAGQTLRDVFRRGNAAGVEGTHRQLGTGFADGLGGDDAHRLADGDRFDRGQVGTVAFGAHAVLGAAGQYRADLDMGHAVGLGQQVDLLVAEHRVVADDHLARFGITEIVDQIPAAEAFGQRLDHFVAFADVVYFDTVVGAAVLLADDDVLRYVDQTAGQIPGVSRTQGGVRQALAGAAGGDEVLQDVQAFTVVGADRHLDGTAGGVGDQAAHTGQLADL